MAQQQPLACFTTCSNLAVYGKHTLLSALLQLWSRNHPHLLPKVQLVSGDMFDADTVPTPPPDSSSTAYVLRNILHDW